MPYWTSTCLSIRVIPRRSTRRSRPSEGGYHSSHWYSGRSLHCYSRFIIGRHLFIYAFLHFTLLYFFDPLEDFAPATPSDSLVQIRGGALSPKTTVGSRESAGTRVAHGRCVCANCGRSEDTAGGDMFKVCNKCAAVGWRIYYCDR